MCLPLACRSDTGVSRRVARVIIMLHLLISNMLLDGTGQCRISFVVVIGQAKCHLVRGIAPYRLLYWPRRGTLNPIR